MNIIDTHTHLYLKQFNEDIDLVINRSKEIGVKKFIFPAIDSSHFDSMHSLKNKYPDNKNYLEIVKCSAFANEHNEIVQEHYHLSTHSKLSIIPPVGGG